MAWQFHILKQRFSELILAQYVVNLSIPEKDVRKKETLNFTNYLRAEGIDKDPEILSLSRLLVRTGGKIINPAVKFRNVVQTNKTWRVVERGLLNTVKRMKK